MKKEYLNNPLNEELNNLKQKEINAKKKYYEAKERLNEIYEKINDIEISIIILEMKHYFSKKKKEEKASKIEILKKALKDKRKQIFYIQNELAISLINYRVVSAERLEKENEIKVNKKVLAIKKIN